MRQAARGGQLEDARLACRQRELSSTVCSTCCNPASDCRGPAFARHIVYLLGDRPAAQGLRTSQLGAQSVCAEVQGAFTGEVSAAMLRDVGCRYVLVGHSERRHIYGESDALVARKFVAAQSQKLVPVLCVGETLDEREAGRTVDVVITADRCGLP